MLLGENSNEEYKDSQSKISKQSGKMRKRKDSVKVRLNKKNQDSPRSSAISRDSGLDVNTSPQSPEKVSPVTQAGNHGNIHYCYECMLPRNEKLLIIHMWMFYKKRSVFVLRDY